MSRVPWPLTIQFPRGTVPLILETAYKVVSEIETQLVYTSSQFELRVDCISCNVRPTEFRPTYKLQQRTQQPYLWTPLPSGHMMLTIAAIDVVEKQKISGGILTVTINGAPVPYLCEHNMLQCSMPVHSSQPNYERRSPDEPEKPRSKPLKAKRINDEKLPMFYVHELPCATSNAEFTESDKMLCDITADMIVIDHLRQEFYLPNFIPS